MRPRLRGASRGGLHGARRAGRRARRTRFCRGRLPGCSADHRLAHAIATARERSGMFCAGRPYGPRRRRHDEVLSFFPRVEAGAMRMAQCPSDGPSPRNGRHDGWGEPFDRTPPVVDDGAHGYPEAFVPEMARNRKRSWTKRTAPLSPEFDARSHGSLQQRNNTRTYPHAGKGPEARYPRPPEPIPWKARLASVTTSLVGRHTKHAYSVGDASQHPVVRLCTDLSRPCQRRRVGHPDDRSAQYTKARTPSARARVEHPDVM